MSDSSKKPTSTFDKNQLGGKALLTLWLGFGSMCLGPLTGVPAVLVGLLSLMEISGSGGALRGRRETLLGMSIGGGLTALFCVLCFGWYSGWFTTEPVVPEVTAVQRQINEYREKVTDWNAQRKKLETTLGEFESDRKTAMNKLKGAEAGNQQTNLLAKEVLSIDQQLKLLQAKKKAYNSAIAKMEVALRDAERRQKLENVGVSEDDLTDLAVASRQLDDELSNISEPGPVEEFDIQAILDEANSN